jgi:N-acetylmuramoyl-L-alanine amidase
MSDPLDTMARTVWGEARGEGERGMEAVAWVIKNRASRPCWWGNDIESVCRKAKQFSCWNIGNANYTKCAGVDDRDDAFRLAKKVCTRVLEGSAPYPTNGANHYYAKNIRPPRWAREEMLCAEIGNHRFYRL